MLPAGVDYCAPDSKSVLRAQKNAAMQWSGDMGNIPWFLSVAQITAINTQVFAGIFQTIPKIVWNTRSPFLKTIYKAPNETKGAAR